MKTWQRIKTDLRLVQQYLVRETVIDAIRFHLKSSGFREVFTPIMVPIPSIESNLEVFVSQLRTSKGQIRSGFLIMSPEYAIKKLLSAGVGSVFEITRAFRNEEEVSPTHNPEFTMLEWYRVNADYTRVMQDFEEMFCAIIRAANPKADLSSWQYQGDTYNLTTPWPRWSIAEAFQEVSGITPEVLLDEKKLFEVALTKGYSVSPTTTWEQIFYQILFNEIEPAMKNTGKPVFLYDYPVSQASLSKKKVSDPRFAERFEVFLAGMELGNCFSELLDADEQRARFQEDYMSRKTSGKTDYPIDEELLTALASGMPEVSGIAVGVDRLVMLAADVPTISDTLFFPAHELFDLK
jgi:lysyl-tRNA synthetase class 2